MSRAKKKSITQMVGFALVLAVLAAVAFFALPSEKIWAYTQGSGSWVSVGREGTLTIKVVNKEGTALSGAKVTIAQTRIDPEEGPTRDADASKENVDVPSSGFLVTNPYLDSATIGGSPVGTGNVFSDENEYFALIAIEETTSPTGYEAFSGELELVYEYPINPIAQGGGTQHYVPKDNSTSYKLNVRFRNDHNAGGAAELTDDGNNNFVLTIINEKKQDQNQTITLKKIWVNDTEADRPDNITAFVAYEAPVSPTDPPVTGEKTTEGATWDKDGNTWTTTIDIPQEIDGNRVLVTEVGEKSVPQGYSYTPGEAHVDSSTYELINTRADTGKLTITKTIEGTAANAADEFTFEVALTLNGDTVEGNFSGVTFSEGKATLKLKGGESKTIEGLPVGVEYAIEETDALGYECTSSGETGTISKDSPATAAFTNKKDSTTPPKPTPDPVTPGTEYTITYVLNGGQFSGSTDNIVETYAAGTEIKIHEAPVREGYDFLYWKGSEYQPGDNYTVTEDHTFTAQWKAKTVASKSTAKTGDYAPIAVLVGLVAAGAIGLVAVMVRRNRSNK